MFYLEDKLAAMLQLEDQLAEHTFAFNNIFKEAAGFGLHAAKLDAIFRQAEDFARQTADFRIRRTRRNRRLEEFQNQSGQNPARCPDHHCEGTLALTPMDEPERVSEVAGIGYDLKCTACKLIIYLPPMMSLKRQADQYYKAALILRAAEEQRQQLTDPTIFLAHHAAEMYLKSLGTCTLYPENELTQDGQQDDREWLAGPALERRNHDLTKLLSSVYQFIRGPLKEYGKSEENPGESVSELVKAIPPKTSEYYRYGVLKRGDAEVDFEDDRIAKALWRLCKLLKRFATDEANW